MKEFSEPSNSVWINASAGNGKTKILTDRVLRLILSSNNFSKILCITFTQNAASEIESRILAKILAWSSQDLKEIEQDIEKNFKYTPSKQEIKRAKDLYLEYLNSATKLNIQTIHSFCQKMLSLFTLETNISYEFKIISEYQKTEVIKKVKKKLFLSKDYKNIGKYIFSNIHETQIDKMLLEAIEKIYLFQNIESSSDKDTTKLIGEKFEITSSFDYQKKKLIEDKILNKYINNIDIEEIHSLFLTKSGEKKYISEKKFNADTCYIKELQEKFFQLENALQNKLFLIHSKIIKIFLESFIKLYEKEKNNLGFLDYQDLIIKTLDLLNKPNIKDWMLYKLDNFIDHILVDEAQDTNPYQWQIIDSLIREYYSNYNYNNQSEKKSIFIVGDLKQSIFSFQSVDLNYYLQFIKTLEKNFISANCKFISQELFTSYRSAKEINNFVFAVFSNIQEKYPDIALPISEIESKKSFEGKIEIWPLYKNQKDIIKSLSIVGNDNIEKLTEEKFLSLANDIYNFIEDKINSKITLKSQNRIVEESDFLILCRKRSQLTEALQKRFSKSKIKLSSFGKTKIKENIIGQDFMSIAKFLLNPYDELNLASVLKIPSINLTEDELQKLILCKTENLSLWECIKNNYYNSNELSELSQKIHNQLSQMIKLHQEFESNNIFLFIADNLGIRKLYEKKFEKNKLNIIIDELIYLNYEYINNQNQSLNQFVTWIENDNPSLNIENPIDNNVKLMTIHASKGLEAPIVILCDAHSVPSNTMNLFYKEGELFVKNPGKNSFSSLHQEIVEKEHLKMLQEYIRLLYVALTRASEYLVICDVQSNVNSQYSWIKLIKESLKNIDDKISDKKIILGRQNEVIKCQSLK
ncbi:MAG: UvrD-helicase domain-containing protein [Rickettsia sp.]|nr:UvrD-helicase domain-containing protein [Rickettsia sp.]